MLWITKDHSCSQKLFFFIVLLKKNPPTANLDFVVNYLFEFYYTSEKWWCLRFTEQLSSHNNRKKAKISKESVGFLFCGIALAFCCICAQNSLQLSDLAELVQCRVPSVQQIWVWEEPFFSHLSVNTPLLRHMHSTHSFGDESLSKSLPVRSNIKNKWLLFFLPYSLFIKYQSQNVFLLSAEGYTKVGHMKEHTLIYFSWTLWE